MDSNENNKSDSIYGDLSQECSNTDSPQLKKPKNDLDLYEDYIVTADERKTNDKIVSLQHQLKSFEEKNKELREKSLSLEQENKIVLKNIGIIWKTCHTLLSKKQQDLANSKKEIDALIFKRAVKQVSKDDLDRAVSHIAAYQPKEFKNFIKVMSSRPEPTHCRVNRTFVPKPISMETLSTRVLGRRASLRNKVEFSDLEKLLARGRPAVRKTKQIRVPIKCPGKIEDFPTINNPTSGTNTEQTGNKSVGSRMLKSSEQNACFKNGEDTEVNQKENKHFERSPPRRLKSRIGIRNHTLTRCHSRNTRARIRGKTPLRRHERRQTLDRREHNLKMERLSSVRREIRERTRMTEDKYEGSGRTNIKRAKLADVDRHPRDRDCKSSRERDERESSDNCRTTRSREKRNLKPQEVIDSRHRQHKNRKHKDHKSSRDKHRNKSKVLKRTTHKSRDNKDAEDNGSTTPSDKRRSLRRRHISCIDNDPGDTSPERPRKPKKLKSSKKRSRRDKSSISNKMKKVKKSKKNQSLKEEGELSDSDELSNMSSRTVQLSNDFEETCLPKECNNPIPTQMSTSIELQSVSVPVDICAPMPSTNEFGEAFTEIGAHNSCEIVQSLAVSDECSKKDGSSTKKLRKQKKGVKLESSSMVYSNGSEDSEMSLLHFLGEDSPQRSASSKELTSFSIPEIKALRLDSSNLSSNISQFCSPIESDPKIAELQQKRPETQCALTFTSNEYSSPKPWPATSSCSPITPGTPVNTCANFTPTNNSLLLGNGFQKSSTPIISLQLDKKMRRSFAVGKDCGQEAQQKKSPTLNNSKEKKKISFTTLTNDTTIVATDSEDSRGDYHSYIRKAFRNPDPLSSFELTNSANESTYNRYRSSSRTGAKPHSESNSGPKVKKRVPFTTITREVTCIPSDSECSQDNCQILVNAFGTRTRVPTTPQEPELQCDSHSRPHSVMENEQDCDINNSSSSSSSSSSSGTSGSSSSSSDTNSSSSSSESSSDNTCSTANVTSNTVSISTAHQSNVTLESDALASKKSPARVITPRKSPRIANMNKSTVSPPPCSLRDIWHQAAKDKSSSGSLVRSAKNKQSSMPATKANDPFKLFKEAICSLKPNCVQDGNPGKIESSAYHIFNQVKSREGCATRGKLEASLTPPRVKTRLSLNRSRDSSFAENKNNCDGDKDTIPSLPSNDTSISSVTEAESSRSPFKTTVSPKNNMTCNEFGRKIRPQRRNVNLKQSDSWISSTEEISIHLSPNRRSKPLDIDITAEQSSPVARKRNLEVNSMPAEVCAVRCTSVAKNKIHEERTTKTADTTFEDKNSPKTRESCQPKEHVSAAGEVGAKISSKPLKRTRYKNKPAIPTGTYSPLFGQSSFSKTDARKMEITISTSGDSSDCAIITSPVKDTTVSAVRSNSNKRTVAHDASESISGISSARHRDTSKTHVIIREEKKSPVNEIASKGTVNEPNSRTPTCLSSDESMPQNVTLKFPFDNLRPTSLVENRNHSEPVLPRSIKIRKRKSILNFSDELPAKRKCASSNVLSISVCHSDTVQDQVKENCSNTSNIAGSGTQTAEKLVKVVVGRKRKRTIFDKFN